MFGRIDSKGALPKFESIPGDLSTPPPGSHPERPKSDQERSKRRQEGPKSGQERLKTGQERAKRGQEQPKSGQERPRAAQERSKGYLGGLLARFGTILEGQNVCFSLRFSIVFEKHSFGENMSSRAILVLNLGHLGQPRAPQEQPRAA